MNNVIEAMLSKYNPTTNTERENAIKEIIQEIALSGLARGGFFDKAAFYGGTCLRMFYGLNRFSEDLDFALLKKDDSFRLDDYLGDLKRHLLSYGLDVDVESKKKDADIHSAFIKGNTLMLMMSFFPNNDDARKVVANQRIKIKFEIDIDNPDGGVIEKKYKMLPSPYEITVFNEATLFAGKIHAILCRDYKNNVKGRDYYDYLFYIGKGSKFNLIYLENKLKNSGVINKNISLNVDMVKEMLKKKFTSINYEIAKKDVYNFITDKDSLDFWKPELFVSSLDELKAE